MVLPKPSWSCTRILWTCRLVGINSSLRSAFRLLALNDGPKESRDNSRNNHQQSLNKLVRPLVCRKGQRLPDYRPVTVKGASAYTVYHQSGRKALLLTLKWDESPLCMINSDFYTLKPAVDLFFFFANILFAFIFAFCLFPQHVKAYRRALVKTDPYNLHSYSDLLGHRYSLSSTYFC